MVRVGHLASPTDPQNRFYGLADAAKEKLRDGDLDTADALASELLALAPQFPGDWNHGNAIHHGHKVRGLVALAHGDVARARVELLASGDTEGSPQLVSFGPSMALAQALLARGEIATVLEYFEQCRRFWEMGREDLDEWTADVKAHREPAFFANLCY